GAIVTVFLLRPYRSAAALGPSPGTRRRTPCRIRPVVVSLRPNGTHVPHTSLDRGGAAAMGPATAVVWVGTFPQGRANVCSPCSLVRFARSVEQPSLYETMPRFFMGN